MKRANEKEESPTPEPRAVHWALVDHSLARARERFAAAGSQSDWEKVGYHCGEAIVALAHAVAWPQLGASAPSSGLSVTTAKEFLDRHLAETLSTDAVSAAFVKSALALAERDCTAGTTEKRSAALCLQATTACVGTVSIAVDRTSSPHTIAELINKFIDGRALGDSQLRTLQVIARSTLGQKRAATLQVPDVIDYFRARLQAGDVSPSTITQYLSFLRGVFKTARQEWHWDIPLEPLDNAKRLMAQLSVTGRSQVRTRRPTDPEIKKLRDYFIEQSKYKWTKIPMADVMDFALWTGRRLGEICTLRWSQIDKAKRQCTIGGTTFPLVQQAWEIIERQPNTGDRIFQVNTVHSASHRYTQAIRKLKIENLRFQDLRREAAVRLTKAGYTLDQVGAALGRKDLNSLQRDIERDMANKN